jgi:uncharacterized Zn finger protein (UPF0148 family)
MKQNNRKSLKKGSDAFSSCPACESPNLEIFEYEVMCSYCGWDSIAVRVEARFAQMGNSLSIAEMIEEAAQKEVFPLWDTTESFSEREENSSQEARRLLQEEPLQINDLTLNYDVA